MGDTLVGLPAVRMNVAVDELQSPALTSLERVLHSARGAEPSQARSCSIASFSSNDVGHASGMAATWDDEHPDTDKAATIVSERSGKFFTVSP